MIRYSAYAVLLTASALSVSGCTIAKEQLGIGRHSPDEFTVMERAPLEMPTDMASLPRPQPGAPRPQETVAVTQAKATLLGEDALKHDAPTSASESALLARTGAHNTPADIRAKVNVESHEAKNDKRAVIKRILNLGKGEAPANVVVAPEEAKRILKDKAEGKPVTGAATPTVEQ